MIWQVKFTDQARKELRSLDHEVQRRIIKYLRERIETADDPRCFGKALVGDKSGLWRYRIGDHRVVCLIQIYHLSAASRFNGFSSESICIID